MLELFAYAGVVFANAGVFFRLLLECLFTPMLKMFAYAGIGFAYAEVVCLRWSVSSMFVFATHAGVVFAYAGVAPKRN